MATVSDVIGFFEKFAPRELAEDWDNTGLLIGRHGRSVSKLMTCLTLTPDVAEEAVTQGVDLIVTHHPVLFRAVRQVTDQSSEGSMLLLLIENGVAVYSPHTQFDSAARGINQQLAEAFGLSEIKPVRLHDQLDGLGAGRFGVLPEPTSLEIFLGLVRSSVSGKYIEYCGELTATVSRVAVACGAAGEFLDDAIQLGCDTFVTGESRFHSALQARTAGINLVLLGHYSSERPAVESLADMLIHAIDGIEVFASHSEQDPLSVFMP